MTDEGDIGTTTSCHSPPTSPSLHVDITADTHTHRGERDTISAAHKKAAQCTKTAKRKWETYKQALHHWKRSIKSYRHGTNKKWSEFCVCVCCIMLLSGCAFTWVYDKQGQSKAFVPCPSACLFTTLTHRIKKRHSVHVRMRTMPRIQHCVMKKGIGSMMVLGSYFTTMRNSVTVMAATSHACWPSFLWNFLKDQKHSIRFFFSKMFKEV